MKEEQTPFNKFLAGSNELYEAVLAEVIDDLYLTYKPSFVDWEKKTHKLGWFKEAVKQRFHEALSRTK